MFAKKLEAAPANEHGFSRTCMVIAAFIAIVTASALAVAFMLPVHKDVPIVSVVSTEAPVAEDTSFETKVEYDDSQLNIDINGEDESLTLYRDLTTRPAVEWFYARVTGNRSVSQSILAECDRNDISPSLAFSLAYMESRYNVKAVNQNKNQSIDRGLFQLNNRTFTKLSEADFFDPAVNARHGLAHLRFCLGTAGNTVSALAMYNAGANRVRSDSTPQITLTYIGKIMGYKQNIEKLFAEEVLRYYSDTDEEENNTMSMPATVAYNK